MVASSSVSDTDPGSSAFLTPGSGKQDGKEKNQDPGWTFLKLKYLNFFNYADLDPDPGWEKIWIRTDNTG